MEHETPRWVRVGIIVTLAIPQLVVGTWALLAPESWYESFPGFDPRLVAAEPPYNQHLVSDVGAGFFATGLGLLLAAVLANRVAVLVALATYAAFTLPHVIYHASHPADALSGAEDAANVLVLGSGLVLAAVFAWGVRGDRRPPAREPIAPTQTGAPSAR
jgi:hypothetical protein